jgi:hypothetical protein
MSSTLSTATPGLADVTDHARMIRVIATVRCEVEGYRNALTAGGKRLAVERIGFLGGRKAGVLADRPRPAHVHRRLRAAHEGLDAGPGIRERQRAPCPRRCTAPSARDAFRRQGVQRRRAKRHRVACRRSSPNPHAIRPHRDDKADSAIVMLLLDGRCAGRGAATGRVYSRGATRSSQRLAHRTHARHARLSQPWRGWRKSDGDPFQGALEQRTRLR